MNAHDASNDALELFATCPKSFEPLLANELGALSTPGVRPLRGQVAFTGQLADAYRVCLWSRLASRVVLVLSHVDAHDADALYEGLSAIAWEEHLGQGTTLAVDAHGTNAELRSTQFVALRSKDAIVDRLLAKRGSRPNVNAARPDVRVAVRVSHGRATVGIDLSGAPLFRRGYESPSGSRRVPMAPLRADYAAALLAEGGWYRQVRQRHAALVSAFAGAGSVVVEAAAQLLDRAPGLLHAPWGFAGWLGHDEATWNGLMDEAQARAEAARMELEEGRRSLSLVAMDTRPGAESAARQLLRAAGMDVPVSFVRQGVVPHPADTRKALLVCDLSWLRADEVAQQARALATCSGLTGAGYDCAVALTANATLDVALGASPAETLPVFMGREPATIRSYDGAALSGERPVVELPSRTGGAPVRVPVLLPASEQFARRLAKIAKARARWTRHEDVSCYRVYDADLPDYAVTIDLFEGSELMPTRHGRGRWLSVYEYAAPHDVDATLARERLLDALAIAPVALGVEPQDVFVRVRTKGRGGTQYANEGTGVRERPKRPGPARRPGNVPLPVGAHLIDEGGLTFEVNFASRLDCGIFLDHRETRALLREMAKGTKGSRRFLNLFAYTGTATCYAADGGCRHTTTVDMSAPSLSWARRNMERNGFTGPENEYVRTDVIRWIGEQRHTKNRWDLVFCDVPTFSNSKGMRGSWDVQRDHVELLIGLSRLLTRDGVAVFSCNLRSFRPDVDALAKAGVAIEDITQETIPEDFARNPKVHHCYLVRRA